MRINIFLILLMSLNFTYAKGNSNNMQLAWDMSDCYMHSMIKIYGNDYEKIILDNLNDYTLSKNPRAIIKLFENTIDLLFYSEDINFPFPVTFNGYSRIYEDSTYTTNLPRYHAFLLLYNGKFNKINHIADKELSELERENIYSLLYFFTKDIQYQQSWEDSWRKFPLLQLKKCLWYQSLDPNSTKKSEPYFLLEEKLINNLGLIDTLDEKFKTLLISGLISTYIKNNMESKIKDNTIFQIINQNYNVEWTTYERNERKFISRIIMRKR